MGEDIRCFYLNVNIRTVKNSCDKDIDIVSGLLPFPDDSLYLRCLTNILFTFIAFGAENFWKGIQNIMNSF